MPQVVIGTAGHIDHGKTSLVKALTGTDTDRLAEEKERGMTIDLGFAYLNESITIIDVPGHEKFIRNMAAGAANVHFGLLVVAADDGIMPQTREHLDILTLLGVKKGIVAITKVDLVQDKEWLDLVELEIQELLSLVSFDSIAVHRVNNLNGNGVSDIKADILEWANGFESVSKSSDFRMYVDRVFSKTGFGTVVTGTVQSGSVSTGDELEIFPKGKQAKIRGIQTHGGETNSVTIGDRAALNLSNAKPNDLKRGSVLTSSGVLGNSTRLIAHFSMTSSTDWKIKNKQRLRFHFGTTEILGRIIVADGQQLKKGDEGNVIIDLESPFALAMDDRFVVRSYSPMETLAGGVVLEPSPSGKWSLLKKRALELPIDPKSRFDYFVTKDWDTPKTKESWKTLFFISMKLMEEWITDLNLKSTLDDFIYSDQSLNKGKEELRSYFLQSYQNNPFRTVLSVEGILTQLKWPERWLRIILKNLILERVLMEEKGGYSLVGTKPGFSQNDLNDLESVDSIVTRAGQEPILLREILDTSDLNPKRVGDLLHLLSEQGKVQNLGNDLWLNRSNLDKVIATLRKYYSSKKEMAVSDFKDMTGLSRKTAIPLLEFLDKNIYTIRKDNVRLAGKTLDE